MKNKQPKRGSHDHKMLTLIDIKERFIGKLTADELYEILNAGEYIYRPDNGLTYNMVENILKEINLLDGASWSSK